MGIRVKEIMDKNPVIVDHKQTIFGLREIVILRQPECILVIDGEKKLVGIMTPTHLATIADVDIEETVTSVMERKFRRVNANMSVREAAALLSASELEALPVVDNNDDLVGVVTYKDIVKDLVEDHEDQMLTPESAVIYLAMTKDPEQEEYWLQKVNNKGYRAAITQVGATAEKLPIKLREATIVAAIARSVIKEDSREKFSVSNASETFSVSAIPSTPVSAAASKSLSSEVREESPLPRSAAVAMLFLTATSKFSWGVTSFNVTAGSCPLRSISNRLSARRRRPHRSFQLALRQKDRRQVHSAH